MRQRFHEHAAAVNSANSQDEEIPIPINGKVNKPKVFHMRKPLTAFKIYCSERRQGIKRSHPELPNSEIKCMLSNMWMTTDTATKLSCEKRSRRQFERYYEVRMRRVFNEFLSTDLKQQIRRANSLINFITICSFVGAVCCQDRYGTCSETGGGGHRHR